VPDVLLPISALTEKDRRDLDFGLTLGVDWVADPHDDEDVVPLDEAS